MPVGHLKFVLDGEQVFLCFILWKMSGNHQDKLKPTLGEGISFTILIKYTVILMLHLKNEPVPCQCSPIPLRFFICWKKLTAHGASFKWASSRRGSSLWSSYFLHSNIITKCFLPSLHSYYEMEDQFSFNQSLFSSSLDWHKCCHPLSMWIGQRKTCMALGLALKIIIKEVITVSGNPVSLLPEV